MDVNINNRALFLKLHNLSRLKEIKLYLVGGYIRDCLLGIKTEPLNLDFALKSGSIGFARYLSKRLKGKFVLLDETFGSARVIIRYEDRRIEMDFTDFRGKDIKEDLCRRDFSINSMAVALENMINYTALKPQRVLRFCDSALADILRFSGIIDPAGGLKDLNAKIIRTVYKDAFKDDPLRILRGFSLAARLKGFKIAPATLRLMRCHTFRLNAVSGERLLCELSKIFIHNASSEYLKQLDSLGALETIFPEIRDMKGVDQGGYHHLDVWQHSLETVRCLELFIRRRRNLKNKDLRVCIDNYINESLAADRKRLWLMKLGALFHDIGKPKAKYIDKDGIVWFTGHERIGCELIKKVVRRLRLSRNEKASLMQLIRLHLRPGYLAKERLPTRRALFRFFRDAKEDAPAILLVWIGDRLATRGKESSKKDIPRDKTFIIRLLKDYFLKPEEVVKPPKLLNGNEVMEIMNIKPGPLVGKILQTLKEAQAEGLVHTKQEAIELLKNV